MMTKNNLKPFLCNPYLLFFKNVQQVSSLWYVCSMGWIDTHAHMYDPAFLPDFQEMWERTAAISHICIPNVNEETLEGMKQLSNSYPEKCFPMLGLHPCEVNGDWKKVWGRILIQKNELPWIAVGETGLDFYWDKTFVAEQEACLAAHVDLANELELPVVLHARESLDRLITLFSEALKPTHGAVFHCFTGSLEQAEWIMAQGYFIGIGGVLTYKNSALKDVVKQLSHHHIVLETDAPYLPPVPFRGKRNEPAFLLETAQCLADLWEMPLHQVMALTTDNAKRLFKRLPQ
jgi:TatD DNase family protein